MKNLLTIVIILLFSFTGLCQQNNNVPSKTEELKWYTWNEGYPLAKQTGKILLIDIYTDWCGWCKKMDRDTYSKPEVIDLINKYFIPVKFNPEKNFIYDVEGNKMTSYQLYSNLLQNQSTGYPTIVFLYPKEKRVYLQAGYLNAENFIKLLNSYINLK